MFNRKRSVAPHQYSIQHQPSVSAYQGDDLAAKVYLDSELALQKEALSLVFNIIIPNILVDDLLITDKNAAEEGLEEVDH